MPCVPGIIVYGTAWGVQTGEPREIALFLSYLPNIIIAVPLANRSIDSLHASNYLDPWEPGILFACENGVKSIQLCQQLSETRPEFCQRAYVGPRFPIGPQKRTCLHLQNGLASTSRPRYMFCAHRTRHSGTCLLPSITCFRIPPQKHLTLQPNALPPHNQRPLDILCHGHHATKRSIIRRNEFRMESQQLRQHIWLFGLPRTGFVNAAW